MNNNMRTAALIAAGIVSAGSVVAEEAKLSPVETALSATTISGYVSTSALFDLTGAEGAVKLPGRSFDGSSKIDQINLDVVKLTIEKGPGEESWSAGYKVDLLFGPDANTLGTTSTLGANTSDFGVKQAYVALHAPVGNGLTAKMGVFDTVIGYEVFESGNNPNFSRSYGYYIEPTQHTGLLLSYVVADWLTINGGIADAWNARINAPGGEPNSTAKDFGLQTYMGSVTLTAPESWGSLKGAQFFGGVVYGLGSREMGDGNPRTSLYAGATVPLGAEGLAVGAAFDYRATERSRFDGDAFFSQDDAEEYATTFAGYVSYQFSKQMKLSARGEYAKGSPGTWGATSFNSGENEEFFGVTGTLDYSLWENVLTRFEFRWDKDLTGNEAFGSDSEPKDDAFIVGLNLLYKF